VISGCVDIEMAEVGSEESEHVVVQGAAILKITRDAGAPLPSPFPLGRFYLVPAEDFDFPSAIDDGRGNSRTVLVAISFSVEWYCR
jgi:hypothetical protein